MTQSSDQRETLRIRGTIRDASGSWSRGEVRIAGERILDVREIEMADLPPGVQVIDAGEAYVLPGAVDAHVHSLSHSGEGIAASTAAAAAGGVTTILEMPFDHSGPINSLDRLRAKQDLADAEARIDVALLGTLAPGTGWREAERLAEHGVAGFKVSLFDTDAFRFPRISDRELLDVMAAVRDVRRTLCVHAENNEIIKARIREEIAAGANDPQVHTRTRPPVSETLGALTAMEVAAETGAPLHLCHLSLPRSVDLLRWYREQGADITMETCPHYLTFVEEDLDEQRARLKINPPLRSREAREGLWERLASGDIPVISSDHAPWPVGLKDRERILDNSSGAPGVQNVVAVALGGALRRDPSGALFGRAVDALTLAPARRYGLDGRKGSLEPGKDADVLVFDPSRDDVISAGEQLSNAGWTPYAGYAPGGRVTHTVSRGRLVYAVDAGLLAAPGQGEIL